jgi:hypothetical protein
LINSINGSTDDIESTTQSLADAAARRIQNIRDELKKEEKQLKMDRQKFEKEKQISMPVDHTDIFQLNVGGEIIITTRQTLMKISKSTLSILFNGRWDYQLPKDQNGNIFFDFNPILFRHLLDQLQTLETANSPILNPPSSPSLVAPFEKMLRKLGFISVSSSSLSNEIIALNIGGEQMITRRNTLAQISQSNLTDMVLYSETNNKNNNGSVFIDHDPKLFRHLLQQLREQTQTINHHLNTSLNETKDSFNVILQRFYLNRK